MTAPAMTQAELDSRAHALAYDSACSVIESNCACVDGIEPRWAVYFDVTPDPDEEIELDDPTRAAIRESVTYLDERGLILRHAENENWITLNDESEATR